MGLVTQKKAGATPVQSLQELSQILGDLQARKQESQRIQKAATDELIPLLAAQRKNETERPRLVQARQTAQYAEQEAKEHLGRCIGKESESAAIGTLREAEQALQETIQALAACDKAFNREATHTRILALREQLQAEEQHERELSRAYAKAKAERQTVALTGLYIALEQVYDIMEYGGAALEAIRNEDPLAYEQLFHDICIDQWELAELFVQRFNIGLEDDYRPELRERQQAVKDRLAKLKK